MSVNIETVREQLCGNCVLTQPDRNCRYREVLAEIAREANGPLPIRLLVAGNAQADLDRGQEAFNEMVEAYRVAAIMGCPNLITTEFPKIDAL